MKILGKREVELDQPEAIAKGRFEDLLSQGLDVPSAAARTEELHPGLDPAFYRWLRGQPLIPTEDPVRSLLGEIARLDEHDLEKLRGALIGEALEGMKVPPAERVAVAIMTVPELATVNICTLAAHQITDGGLTHAVCAEILPRYVQRSVDSGEQVSLADFALYVVARASDEFAALPAAMREAF